MVEFFLGVSQRVYWFACGASLELVRVHLDMEFRIPKERGREAQEIINEVFRKVRRSRRAHRYVLQQVSSNCVLLSYTISLQVATTAVTPETATCNKFLPLLS